LDNTLATYGYYCLYCYKLFFTEKVHFQALSAQKWEKTDLMNNHEIVKTFFYKPAIKGWSYLFLILSYSFLGYKLLTFNQYPELLQQWRQLPASNFWWLSGVFLLLPFNWLLESVKWKMLTAHIQQISLKTAIKGVLAGISSGFFTPNRVGELVGRIVYLSPENRKAGTTLSLLNGLSQNLIMTLCGIPACLLFFATTTNQITPNYKFYLLILLVFLVVSGLFFFFMPQLNSWMQKRKFWSKTMQFTDCLSEFTPKELTKIMGVSLIRYAVFCFQFYWMLGFFGVQLSSWQAFIAIPTNYLFVTFTPSLAFSEATVRGSYAVLTIGAFSGQVVSIALAGMSIWLINFVVPMLVGSVIFARKK
jgi:hypothetical protein